MKFSIERKKFLDALTIGASMAGRTKTVPILECAKCRVKNNEITTRVHEERKHNISFFSIPAQFPLNAFFLRFSYAYPTAEQYHTGTTC